MKDGDIGPGTFWWQGVSYRTVLSSADSQGVVSIVDSVTPAGAGPPRHVHAREDEAFMITSGRALFWLEGAELIRGPGESVFIPRGKEHAFTILGESPCRHLIILTPGGFEGFFKEMAEGGFEIPADMTAIEEAAARHHLTFTGPPLEAR